MRIPGPKSVSKALRLRRERMKTRALQMHKVLLCKRCVTECDMGPCNRYLLQSLVYVQTYLKKKTKKKEKYLADFV